MIYAGLTADDPRVQAAMSFIQKKLFIGRESGHGESRVCIITTTPSRKLLTQPMWKYWTTRMETRIRGGKNCRNT